MDLNGFVKGMMAGVVLRILQSRGYCVFRGLAYEHDMHMMERFVWVYLDSG